MNKKYLIGAAVVALMGSVTAQACDCTISKNWSNPQCKGKTPKGIPTTVLLQPSSTASAGAGASSTSSGTQGQGQTQTNGNNTNTLSSASTSAGGAAHSVSSSVSAGGSATAQGGAGGTAAADNNSTGSGNSTSYTDNSSYEVPRQTPPAILGTVQPTTSCTAARNGGASSPVAALSLGWSAKDVECDLRETSRQFYEMGQVELAVQLLCKSEAAKRLDRCQYAQPAQPAQPVTHQELLEVEKRMLQRGVSK